MPMKTHDEAVAAVRARFGALLGAQRAAVIRERNKLTQLEQEQDQALVRVEEYFDAERAKPLIDATVANPPDEVKV
jgi:hypothetical protein